MWSLAEGFFKHNYCHAYHTRLAVVFPRFELHVQNKVFGLEDA